MASAKPPADPELREKLTTLVGRLTADLGIGGGRSAEGLAAASVAMLSKMTSPYDVTKVAVQQTQKTLTENAPDKRAFASECPQPNLPLTAKGPLRLKPRVSTW